MFTQPHNNRLVNVLTVVSGRTSHRAKPPTGQVLRYLTRTPTPLLFREYYPDFQGFHLSLARAVNRIRRKLAGYVKIGTLCRIPPRAELAFADVRVSLAGLFKVRRCSRTSNNPTGAYPQHSFCDLDIGAMSRISEVFERSSRESRMAFMPFVTSGDPDLAATANVLLTLRDAKVDLIELGFPYSDPIADGPVIQASYTRALDRGITVEGIFSTVESLKNENLPPVLAMVSFAIIFRHGSADFVAHAAKAGFSGLIIPDLPADEADEVSSLAREHGLDLVQLIAPTTTARRTKQILAASTGFLYCISVAGTTGVRQELPPELIDQLKSLRAQSSLPLAVGFGISSPEQVAELAGVADGVIVGSAIVRKMAEARSPAEMSSAVRTFAEQMQAAVNVTKPSR